MTTVRFVKIPDEDACYALDWTDWLEGQTIVTSTWRASGSVTLSDATIVDAPRRPLMLGEHFDAEADDERDADATCTVLSQATLTQVWVQGGLPGEVVDLTNTIVTSTGRSEKRTVEIHIRESSALAV